MSEKDEEKNKLPPWWKTKENWFLIVFIVLLVLSIGGRAFDGHIGIRLINYKG